MLTVIDAEFFLARVDIRRVGDHVRKAGAITVPDVTLYALSEAAEAQRVSESRHFRGKLVFKIQ